MAWTRRQTRRYFQVSVRRNGRVETLYCGRGVAAKVAEFGVAERQRRRDAERQIIAEQVAADRQRQPLADLLANLVNAGMLIAGFHRFDRGKWRLRRGTFQETSVLTAAHTALDRSRTRVA